MARVHGISKDGIKAFSEGNVILKFSKRKGYDVRTYNTLGWVKKAILKAREEGRYILGIYNEDSTMCIVFSDRGFGFMIDALSYRQYMITSNSITIRRPMRTECGVINNRWWN